MFRWIKDDKNDKKKKKDKKKKESELSKEDLKRLDKVTHNFLSYMDTSPVEGDHQSISSSSSVNSLHSNNTVQSSPGRVPPPVPKKPSFLNKNHENNSSQDSGSLTNEMMAIMDHMSLNNAETASHHPKVLDETQYFGGVPVGEQIGRGVLWKHCPCEIPEKVLPPKPLRARTLVIHRQSNGEFGFSLRRKVLIDPQENVSDGEQVIFAEPREFSCQDGEMGLLPGDRLLEVNDVCIDTKSKEEILDLIKSSGDSIKLKVQLVPELSELVPCLGGQEDSRTVNGKGKSTDQLEEALTWLRNDMVWLSHRAGITAAQVVQKLSDGQTRIYIPSIKQEIEVDDELLEQANSPHYDRAMDLSQLAQLNESSLLHTLAHRLASSLAYTYAAGPSVLLAMNPLRPLACYSDNVMKLYKSCDLLPPHPYALAQHIYHQAQTTRRNQALMLLGRSASGKTMSLRHVLNHLAFVASPSGSGRATSVLTVDKANAVMTLLEAFGSRRTPLNSVASRCIQLLTINLDHSGQIISASVQGHMLEKSKVSRRPEGETNFHIFYHLLAGVEDTLRKELFLENTTEFCLFMTPIQKPEDCKKAQQYWSNILGAMKTMEFTDQEVRALLHILAAIYHLGVAGVSRTGSGVRGQFLRQESAKRAATLLGTTLEDLTKGIFPTDYIGFSGRFASKGEAEGLESLQAMAAGLYGEVFNAVVSLINRNLSGTAARTSCSIHLLDLPGLQNPRTVNANHPGASLEDLCFNYCCERIQALFFQHTYLSRHALYQQEKIAWPFGDPPDSSPIASLLDNPWKSNSGTKGMLWLLDEESLCSSVADRPLSEKIMSNFATFGSGWIQQGPSPNQIVIQHAQGTSPVIYNVAHWLAYCKEPPTSRYATALLQDSNLEYVRQLLVVSRAQSSGQGDVMRNSTAARCSQSMVGNKRRSLPLQAKWVMDGLEEVLQVCDLHFLLCLLPQHSVSQPQEEAHLPLVRSQLRGLQVLPVARLYKQGFPDHLSYDLFLRKFEFLVSGDHRDGSGDSSAKVRSAQLVNLLELEPSAYRLGETQIFFRAGVLPSLERQRNQRLQQVVVRLQSQIRSHLAQTRLARLRIQDTAIRVIQRNVKIMGEVRLWPWWRLLSNIRPLLNVHRTEEDLRAKTEEVQNLLAKVAKLEQDNSELRHQNDKLEAKVADLWGELGEEHTAASRHAAMVDADRRRLEQDLSNLQSKYNEIQQLTARMDETRLQPEDLSGSDNEEESMSSIYKQKYERAIRDLDSTKRRLQQQHEEEMEQQFMMKKATDKKLCEALEDLDEERKVASQWKRKAQKLTSEMQDLRLSLEEQMVRNAELEKRQRKFDSELVASQEELRKEVAARERLEREREAYAGVKYSLEQELQATKQDLSTYMEKVALLTREMDELTLSSQGEEEVTQLKRGRQEVERKLAEAEEELEEQAGQVTMLEQAKLRLEMTLEKCRQEFRRDLANKEDEIDDLRATYMKKMKNMEAQLEAEQEERHQLARQRHELERRISELQEALASRQQSAGNRETVQRLRRDLKCTRALLADAQLMLERSRSGDPASKTLIRQLRNQVEDAEMARSAALKSRQGTQQELEELQAQLEDISRTKQEAESRVTQLARERTSLLSQLEEAEEELVALTNKHRAVLQQLAAEQGRMALQAQQVEELEMERQSLRDQLAEAAVRLEQLSGATEKASQAHRMEAKLREVESRLEMEQLSLSRLQAQITKLKEQGERSREESEACRAREQAAKDVVRHLQRQLREAKEELAIALGKETEYQHKLQQLEGELSHSRLDLQTMRNDLRLACQRIQDLQAALEDELDSGTDVPDDDSDSQSSSSSMISGSSGLASSRLAYSSRHSSRRSSLLRTPSQEFSSRMEAVAMEETTSSEV